MVQPGAVGRAVRSQMHLCAEYTPLLGPLMVQCGMGPKARAMSTVEQAREDFAESRNEFLCFRPPRGVGYGATRAAWNVAVGTAGAPAMFAASLLSSLLEDGPIGLVTGAVKGVAFGSAWLALGYLGAALQCIEGAGNTLASPVQQCVRGRRFDSLRGRWVPYTTHKDMHLELFAPTDALWLAAIERHNTRFGKLDRAASSASGGGGVDGARSHYDVLGIEKTATDRQVKEAFGRLAKHLHPDRNPNPAARQQFDDVTKSYKILSDPAQRKKYDAGGDRALKADAEPSKRDALRGVFGGERLAALVGDVRTGRFSRRMIDEAYFMAEDSEVVVRRQREDAVAELLTLLSGHPGRNPAVDIFAARDKQQQQQQKAATSSGSKTGSGAAASASPPAAPPHSDAEAYTAWQAKAQAAVKDLAKLGLSREVLLVVGREYDVAHRFATGSVIERIGVVLRDWPQRARVRQFQLSLGLQFIRKKSQLSNDKNFIMDTCWKLSIPELQATARFVALSVLLDDSADAAERSRRADALVDLAGVFTAAGQPYTGASAALMDKMRDAVLKERQRKQHEKYN